MWHLGGRGESLGNRKVYEREVDSIRISPPLLLLSGRSSFWDLEEPLINTCFERVTQDSQESLVIPSSCCLIPMSLLPGPCQVGGSLHCPLTLDLLDLLVTVILSGTGNSCFCPPQRPQMFLALQLVSSLSEYLRNSQKP